MDDKEALKTVNTAQRADSVSAMKTAVRRWSCGAESSATCDVRSLPAAMAQGAVPVRQQATASFDFTPLDSF